MADEKEEKTENTEGQGKQPDFAASLGAQLTSQIQEGLEAIRRETRQALAPPAPEPDAVTRTIAPVVGPALQAIHQQASAAMDAATFYSDRGPEGELKDKWRPIIEQKFIEAANVGRMVPRQDILNWLKGGEKQEEYFEWRVKQREDAQERARQASTIGGGVGSGQRSGPVKDAWDMPQEELKKFLETNPF